MRGVVLAGGLGTRFYPVTRVLNKHLLDVFDEPMIYYPLRSLARAGIQDITLVTGDEVPQFKNLLGDGSDLGLNLSYAFQQRPEGGIADALAKAEPHALGERIVVILGDNIFQEDLSPYVESFKQQDKGAKVLLKRVSLDDAHRFGIAEVKDGKIVSLEEKPKDPKSDLAQTGCYMYDDRVFEFIRTLKPSWRGQLEVTDLNKIYLDEVSLTYDVLKGWWTDAGTPASKLKASILVALEKGVTFHQ
jgi:glucose-1-phosphate thymidylyltransferase